MNELSILILNAVIVSIAYLLIYPKFVAGNELKILFNDIFASGISLVVVGAVYWGSGQEFYFVITTVNWFWFTIVTFLVIELPFFIWYYRKYNIPFVSGTEEEYVYFNGVKVDPWWPDYVHDCQSEIVYLIEGNEFPRIKYGDEGENWTVINGPCNKCGALRGQYHACGCDVEKCPKCNGYVTGCDCLYDDE